MDTDRQDVNDADDAEGVTIRIQKAPTKMQSRIRTELKGLFGENTTADFFVAHEPSMAATWVSFNLHVTCIRTIEKQHTSFSTSTY